MVNSVDKVDKTYSIHTSILDNVRNKLPSKSVNQTDLITQMENAKKPREEIIQNLRNETNKQAKAFTQNASLYTTVNLLYYWCNTGETIKENDNKIKLVVKDLKKNKKKLGFFTGFFAIRKAMNKHFSQLSFIKMFVLYILFIGWLPKLYIKNSLNKILDFSRTKLKAGDNLPILGRKLLGTTNTYLANFNRTVERFRDNKKNPIGEINTYLQQEFHKKELLGYESINLLHSDFASAASREETRPAFRVFSKQISKLQLLNFKFLKKLKIIRSCLIPITYTVGIIPYIIARITEFIPNRIIKKVHSSIIKFFMPTVLKNTLEAVAQPGFIHAINSFLCDVIQDLLIEMDKKPEEKNIDDPPNIVNEALSKDIKKFSELLYTLLRNEPCQTQEDLKYLQKHGSEAKSNLEGLLKRITPTGYVDREIKQVYVNALHERIIDGFNLLFSQPEKLEEYQCKLINLLNNVFEYVPDPDTDEGKALLEEIKEKQTRRKELIDKLINKGINLATDDKLNEITHSLSRNQKENLILAYRKIQKKSFDNFPFIAQDIEEMKDSSNNTYPTPAQAKIAKEDIYRTMRDIERLFISIKNVLPKENGAVKRQMEKDLGPFLKNEKLLKTNILQIKSLDEQKENLILIKTELEKLKQILKTNSRNPTNEKMALIEQQLRKLDEFNKNHEFDSIILEYKKLENQLKKIHFHDVFANKLQELLKNTFFTNNIIYNLVIAQKEYLINPSDKKEKTLTKARIKIQDFLKQLEKLSSPQEIQEIKFAIKKILETQNPNQLDEIHKKILSLIRKKITIHTSLHKDEKDILPVYVEKCLDNIKKHTEEIPIIVQNMHTDLKQNIENLIMTVDNMQKSLNDIGKQNSKYNLDIYTMTKILTSLSSFGAGCLGFIGNTLSIATTASVLASIYFTPSGGAKRVINSVSIPLAKSSVESASNIIVNPTFYEGLINAYMRQFIDYVKETKGGL